MIPTNIWKIFKGLPQIEWVDSSSDGFGMEFQPAEMEVGRVGEPLLVPKPAAANLHHPDSAVDTLRRTVGDLQTTALRMSHRWFLIVLAACLTGSRINCLYIRKSYPLE